MKADRLYWMVDNLDPKECATLVLYGLEQLVGTPYKIWIRKHMLQVVGIIEDLNKPRFDTQYGRNLPQLSGWKSNGGNHRDFRLVPYNEPRMHKLPVTGELKDTVLAETPMLVLCSRNSDGAGNDMTDFTHEATENELNQHTSMALHMDIMKTSLMDMEDKVNEYQMEAERNLSLASNYGARVTNAESDLRRITEYNLDLVGKVRGLERELKSRTVEFREDDAEIAMKGRNAEERGAFRGMTDAEKISTTVDKHNEITSKIEEISSQPNHQESYVEMKKMLGNLEKKIESMNNKTESVDKKEVP